MMLRSRLQQEAAAAATAQQLLEDEAPGSGSRLKSKDKGKRKTKNKSRAQMQVACINYWRNNPLTKLRAYRKLQGVHQYRLQYPLARASVT